MCSAVMTFLGLCMFEILLFFRATEGCTHVIHTASPFPNQNPSNEDDVIKPAVDGTLAVLKACQKAKVQRVVLTSSVVTIIGKF